jgi:hypothetical protein
VKTYTCAILVLVACARPNATASDSGTDAEISPAPSTSASVAEIASARPREASAAAFSAIEARRDRIVKLDEDHRLAANADAVKAHFGGSLPARLAVQTTELPASHRHALLVTDDTKSAAEATPFALVVGVDDKPIWTKTRPAAGIMAPIGPLAIAPGPERRIALAACDPPTSAVALRLWDEDGSPFADFAAMDADGCDALSVLYWPRHGWILVAVKPGVTRAQLLSERGTLAWQRGVEIGARPRVATGVSLALDTETTFVLVERVPAERAGAPDRVLAFRYDDRAGALFGAPADLGETKLPPRERIVLARPRPGVVRATLGPGHDVELGSNGELLKK